MCVQQKIHQEGRRETYYKVPNVVIVQRNLYTFCNHFLCSLRVTAS